jgi:hypothetical protein
MPGGMMRTAHLIMGTIIVVALALVQGCSPAGKTGTLEFRANGEDFVRQGFVSKDGWAIDFDHVYVTLATITGYQTSPPYDPHSGGSIESQQHVSLSGTHTVDLAEGGDDAEPILLGSVTDAPVGHYNAISWEMVKATSGPSAGYSLSIVGTATKDGQVVDFEISVESEYAYSCGEYVGDKRKGILEVDGVADLEMTFHFDHIFGDADTPPDDDLNAAAVGFEPFADAASGGRLASDLSGLESTLSGEGYQTLKDILPTLGHVGEGHCHCDAH